MSFWMTVAVAILFFITGWLVRDLPETAAPISEVQADTDIDSGETAYMVWNNRNDPKILAALCDARPHKPGGPSDYATFLRDGYTYIYRCIGDGR